MKKIAKILRERGAELAMLMAAEMGKPLKQGIAEVEKCAWVCEYYAKNAEAYLAPDDIKTEGSKSYVSFEPLSVVFAVMRWNFPLWPVFRFAAPALMAGNVGVLKQFLERARLRTRNRIDLYRGRFPQRRLPHVAYP